MNEIKDRDDYTTINMLETAKDVITKEYLSKLVNYEVEELSEELRNIDINDYVRIFRFTKMVSDEKENVIDKFITVLNAAYSCNATVITLIVGKKDITEYYLGVVSKDISQETQAIETQSAVLESTLTGNFPGLDIKEVRGDDRKKVFTNAFAYDYISSISGISSIRNEENNSYENYVQGIEHLVDSLQGREYSILVLADPVCSDNIAVSKRGFEMLASELSPFLKTNVSNNESRTITLTTSQTESFTETIGESTSYAQSYSSTSGWSDSRTESKTKNLGSGIGTSIGTVAGGIVGGVFAPATGGLSVAAGIGLGGGLGAALGGALGGLFGSKTTGVSTTESGNTTKGSTSTTGNSKSEARQTGTSESEAESLLDGTTVQIEYENKVVKDLLDKIDGNIKRLQKCETYGAFNCAAYVISSDYASNTIVSSAYNALMRGDNSALQASQINTWDTENKNGKLIKEYLKKLEHPCFKSPFIENVRYTPALLTSAYEVAVSIGLPKKSINGIAVSEMAAFGRNIYKAKGLENNSNSLSIGKISHMGKVETTEVDLSLQSLASHTFITGSTGSGKSNTVYQMLKELTKKDVRFLVIEPAKGEYKNVFGNEAYVYGTNPKVTPLLKINPFRFPDGIHVLEHIDRIVELFNVCWPMYAAMPAVLKDAVEKAYIDTGWNLITSENDVSKDLFPTFEDVLFELNDIIMKSAFSQEVKDNYVGSLSTRIKSLTNGIFGQIFTNREIGDDILFDENVVIDLSRVGSVETKSMIMGIIVMRLQEYRMTMGDMNSSLKHVTVLEEAHNLLKRTSLEQNSESANLLGKSVEMLSNAIAEVRTYGEGFIIVDQAPGLMDKSVIRNTNTKIIMRLPDAEDREIVGRSANLTDEQIKELAKLPTGVGAIYQNDWQEPVLCRVDYEDNNGKYVGETQMDYSEDLREELVYNLLSKVAGEKIDKVDCFVERIINSSIPGKIKNETIKIFNQEKIELSDIKSIVYALCVGKNAELKAEKVDSLEEWKNVFISNSIIPFDRIVGEKQNQIVECILLEQIEKYNKPKEYLDIWHRFLEKEVM